jgi:anti-anti-sigma factor
MTQGFSHVILGAVTELLVSVTVHDGGGRPCTVIHLAGEADVSTRAVSEVFDAEVAKRPRLLIVDLSGLSFIDSWALSVIMLANRALRRDGSTLALVSPTPAVARILELIDIAHMIPVCPTLEDAANLLACASMEDVAKGSRAVDPSVPNLARMYDYWLGGKDNFAADRAAAAGMAAAIPELPALARENRGFLGRAVKFCVKAGVTQFLDIGSGLPTMENVHEAAALVTDQARVVYVDNDPVVVSHARALLATERTSAFLGDLTRPAEVLARARDTGLIDFTRPAAVLLTSVLHHVPDEADPAGCVAAFRAALAPGSYLVISHAQLAPGHVRGHEPVSELGSAIVTAQQGVPRGNGTRTRAEIAAFFGGMTLAEPGLTAVWAWRPGPVPVTVTAGVLTILGGVARKD